MTMISVDTAAMQQLAERIREAAAQADLGADDRASLQPMVAALAAPPLVHAVGTFIESWGVTLADLVDDAHRLADAIDLVARTYQDADALTERGILG